MAALGILQELAQQHAALSLVLESLQLYPGMLIKVVLDELLLEAQDRQEVQLQLAEVAKAELVEEQRIDDANVSFMLVEELPRIGSLLRLLGQLLQPLHSGANSILIRVLLGLQSLLLDLLGLDAEGMRVEGLLGDPVHLLFV